MTEATARPEDDGLRVNTYDPANDIVYVHLASQLPASPGAGCQQGPETVAESDDLPSRPDDVEDLGADSNVHGRTAFVDSAQPGHGPAFGVPDGARLAG